MGYKRNRKVYDLKFGTDTEYAGLEVKARTLTMGQLFKVWTEEGTGGSAATFEMFMACLVSWNLEDEEGNPVPVTREAVENEDDDLVNAILKEWLAAVRGVPTPLDGDSNSGEVSPGALGLTEASSPNQAS